MNGTNCNKPPRHVLVVEDDALVQVAVSSALESEGFTVRSLDNGQDALTLLQQLGPCQQTPFDLVILDLLLPQVSGWEICQFLRQQSAVPILILSARDSLEDKVQGLDMGADDYLTKPFSLRELVVRCKKLVQPIGSFPLSPLQFKDLALYPHEARVMLRGNELRLPFKEFCLLRLLMERPQQPWSRQELIRRVWGDDFDGNPKTLDVHITQLRKKLERNPACPEYIVTVRGVGYQLGDGVGDNESREQDEN
ncbi:MAG: response regulator transcription factor [Synechococcales cyanobacterium M58_A2018_015]|nr:response regulator transcription factor [Synechococcales cyanobacterium M58_A2018_015]